MILYLDTSALVKAYVTEVYSDKVRDAIKQADAVSTSLVTYIETRASFAQIKREKVLTEKQHLRIKEEFDKDWNNYLRVEITKEILYRAATYSESFGLRAYDSLHLASADYVRTDHGPAVVFACFDTKLNHAARELGLEIF